jgi:crossover junction endodeoxyribonuclease RuvC
MQSMRSVPQVAQRRGAAPVPAHRAVSILGVDPGLRRTGYAVLQGLEPRARVVEAGVIRLNLRSPLEQRLLELETSLNDLVALHRPDALACEALYAHYRHPLTSVLMGHARGVILLVAARRGLEVLDLPATHVKKMLTGCGHAGKEQVQRAVAATLAQLVPSQPSDVSDAIAIALCGLRMRAAARLDPDAERVAGRLPTPVAFAGPSAPARRGSGVARGVPAP